NGTNMIAVCKAKYLRISPRKLNQILYLVRNKKLSEVYKILKFINKKASTMVLKAIKSAHANLGINIDPQKIIVKEIYVNDGPSMKRIMPMAYGRWALFKRRTSHLFVKLETEDGTKNSS
ncbi:MAG: 50S ribosomal protein L22, partial [bacterium]|nr:50S ribosomal protein L22 [bacterium]